MVSSRRCGYVLLTAALTACWPAAVHGQNTPPAPVAFTVSHGSASSSFSFTFSDANGANTITSAEVLFRSLTNPASQCKFAFDRKSDQLVLSEGSTVVGGIARGSSQLLQGAMCTVDGVSYKLTQNKAFLVLSFAVAFHAELAGDKHVLMQATDVHTASSPLLLMGQTGTFTATSVSVSPVTASLFAGHTKQFAASVVGAATTAVTWSTSVGTVSAAG